LKILRRSQPALSSCSRRSMASHTSHVLGSVHRHGRLTVPRPGRIRHFTCKGSPAHVSLASQPGTWPGIRPVIPTAPAGGLVTLLPFGRRHCFPSVLFPPGNGAPLMADLPGAPRRHRRTLTGFPRSARMRCGRAGCPPLPQGRRCSRDHRDVRDRRLPPCNGCPCHPGTAYCLPTRNVGLDEASARIQSHSPFRPSLTCSPRSEQATSGFP